MKRGFTLIEVLITMVIMSIVIGGLFMVLNIADLNWSLGGGLLGLQQQVRQAMDGMVREIRQNKPSDIKITDVGGTEVNPGPVINFKIPDNTYCFRYSLSNNQIIRQVLACAIPLAQPTQLARQVLANDIVNLNFSCLGGTSCADAPVVQIQIRATKNIRGRDLCFPSPCNPPQSLTEKVKIRN